MGDVCKCRILKQTPKRLPCQPTPEGLLYSLRGISVGLNEQPPPPTFWNATGLRFAPSSTPSYGRKLLISVPSAARCKYFTVFCLLDASKT